MVSMSAEILGYVLTSKDLAARLGMSEQTLRIKRSQRVDLPQHFKLGRFIRYRLEDVERWEREQVEKETARRAAAAAQTEE